MRRSRILLFAPLRLGARRGGGDAVATHEVVRRLREAGYAHPVDPAAGRRPGDDLADVAVRSGGRAGRLTAAPSWCA